MKRSAVLAIAAASFIVACQSDRPLAPRPSGPSAAISDAAHENCVQPAGPCIPSNPHFFFLPPMVERQSFSGTFNPNLTPRVDICVLGSDGDTCAPAEPHIDPGSVALSGAQYQVNWKTDPSVISTSKVYRVQVFVGSQRLGFADVEPVSKGSQLRNVETGELLGLENGRTLPIKFRIENQALCAGTPDCMEATVGAAAQDVVTPSQRAATHFDAGSFSQPVELVIEKIATDGKNVVCHMTDLQQFDDCYNIRVTPNIPLNEGHFARVEICLNLDPTDPNASTRRDPLLVRSEPGVPGVVELAEAPHTLITCPGYPSVAPLGARGARGPWDVASAGWHLVRGLFEPQPLHAATGTSLVIDEGLGGLTPGFSHFGWVIPKVLTISAGNGQTAAAGTSLPVNPNVCVATTHPRMVPVVGDVVTFVITSGGGKVLPSGLDGPAVDLATVPTNAAGCAEVVWRLGTAGTNSLMTSVPFAAQRTQTFTATGELVAGTYRGGVTFTRPNIPVFTLPATYVLAQSGTSVTGTWSIQDALSGNVVATGTISATINGALLAFTVTGAAPCDGTATGSVTITNAGGTLSGSSSGSDCLGPVSTTVLVNRVAPVASVIVTPTTATIGPGGTVQLTATTKDAAGNVLTGRAVTWTSGNTAAATVSASGLVTGVAAGSPTITATSEGQSGTASVTVTGGLGTWTSKASMPTARYAVGVGTSNATLYAVGGFRAGALATVEAYDPVTNSWVSKAPMPTARHRLAVGVVDGILYAIGGLGSSNSVPVATVEAYNPVTDSWTTKASMPTARDDLAVGVVNGILYAVGGVSPDVQGVSTVEAYDPTTNTWTTKASMPTPRFGLGVAAINGTLYAVGGASNAPNGGVYATVEAYDPGTDTWTTKAAMSAPRHVLGVGAIDGKLYAAGGFGGPSVFLTKLEAYDPVADAWTTKASMPTARAWVSVGVVGGILYAVGGAGPASIIPLATVEAYQP